MNHHAPSLHSKSKTGALPLQGLGGAPSPVKEKRRDRRMQFADFGGARPHKGGGRGRWRCPLPVKEKRRDRRIQFADFGGARPHKGGGRSQPLRRG